MEAPTCTCASPSCTYACPMVAALVVRLVVAAVDLALRVKDAAPVLGVEALLGVDVEENLEGGGGGGVRAVRCRGGMGVVVEGDVDVRGWMGVRGGER